MRSAESLPALAVDLLRGSGCPDDAAHLAASRGLAGLWRAGARANGVWNDVSDSARDLLQRSAQREALADELDVRRTRFVLRALEEASVPAVLLKGRSLAETVWPHPAYRPAGDVDVLVGGKDLDAALAVLLARGLEQTGSGTNPFPLPPKGVDLAGTCPDGNPVVVDLHAALFITVGSALDPDEMIGRAREATIAGCRTLVLDPVDDLLFLVIHGAKHALRSLKMMLDLGAVLSATDADTMTRACERAREKRVATPFAATLGAVLDITGITVDWPRPELRSRFGIRRRALARVLSYERVLEGQWPTAWERRSIDYLLEDDPRRQMRLAAAALVRRAPGFGR
jgi:hypothetical protein